jgi:hypothetical protein
LPSDLRLGVEHGRETWIVRFLELLRSDLRFLHLGVGVLLGVLERDVAVALRRRHPLGSVHCGRARRRLGRHRSARLRLAGRRRRLLRGAGDVLRRLLFLLRDVAFEAALHLLRGLVEIIGLAEGLGHRLGDLGAQNGEERGRLRLPLFRLFDLVDLLGLAGGQALVRRAFGRLRGIGRFLRRRGVRLGFRRSRLELLHHLPESWIRFRIGLRQRFAGAGGHLSDSGAGS